MDKSLTLLIVVLGLAIYLKIERPQLYRQIEQKILGREFELKKEKKALENAKLKREELTLKESLNEKTTKKVEKLCLDFLQKFNRKESSQILQLLADPVETLKDDNKNILINFWERGYVHFSIPEMADIVDNLYKEAQTLTQTGLIKNNNNNKNYSCSYIYSFVDLKDFLPDDEQIGDTADLGKNEIELKTAELLIENYRAAKEAKSEKIRKIQFSLNIVLAENRVLGIESFSPFLTLK